MRKIILPFILLIASGCNSTVESLQSANTQGLLIDTPHVEGAECEVSDGEGRKWHLWETPGTVAIQEGHPPLVVLCTKHGFKKSILTINEHKQEMLEIDGKHIDVSIHNQFATKFPRLLPATMRETAGFVQDPTGSLSTKYPDKVTVWMEPKKWESEEQMREWAFDREVDDNAVAIAADEAKMTDEERKAKRRAEAQEREKKFDDFVKNTKDKFNPIPDIKKGYTNMTKILNPMPALGHAVDNGIGPTDARPAIDHAEHMLNPLPALSNAKRVINPETTKDYLLEQDDVRQQGEEANQAEDKRLKSIPGSQYVPVDRTVRVNKDGTIHNYYADPQYLNNVDPGAGTVPQSWQTQDGKVVYDQYGNRIKQ